MKTTRFFRCVMAGMAVASLALTACSSDDNGNNKKDEPFVPRELTPAQVNIVGANNDFAFRAYNHFAEESDRNMVFSPQSIDVCMSMTAVLSPDMGVNGQGRKILDWLGCPAATSVEDLCDLKNIIDRTLKNVDPKVTYESANNFFTNLKVANPDAETILSDYYDCTPTRYKNLKSEVNKWVDEKTHGKITEIIKEESQNPDRSILINALYFKGDWADEFDTSKTKTITFHNALGQDNIVYAMCDTKRHSENVRYMETDTYQTLFMAYGNGAYEMVVILPKEKSGLDNVMKSLTPADLIYRAPEKDMSDFKVDITLPKFTITNKFQLLDWVKQSLGLNGLKIATLPESFVEEIGHVACIEVDEKGSTAAAVTWTGSFTSNGESNVAEFKADHPFAFAIREKSTGAIIMMGRVSDL